MDTLTFREKFPELNAIQRNWLYRDLEKIIIETETQAEILRRLEEYFGKDTVRPTGERGVSDL